MDNFDPYNVLLSIATNIPVLLMTAFVLQGDILQTNCRCFIESVIYVIDVDAINKSLMLLNMKCLK